MLEHTEAVVVVVVVVCVKMFWRNVSDWLILLSEIKALMLSLDKMNSVGVVPAA